MSNGIPILKRISAQNPIIIQLKPILSKKNFTLSNNEENRVNVLDEDEGVGVFQAFVNVKKSYSVDS
ncbi:MAG: hypothetical protein HEEMFOPI_01799 [Holosporales bacterium]